MPRDLRLYLLFIGLPALLLGTGGARLLLVERGRADRVRERLETLAAERAERAVRRHVAETRERLLQRIRETPRETLIPGLREWCETEPLARNVFVWQKDAGPLWPAPESATDEERAFLARFAALLAKDAAWPDNAESPTRPRGAQHPRPSGWIPWFEGQQLHLLGWAGLQTNLVAGVELEMAALLSRLPAVAQSIGETENAIALRDGNGRAVMVFGAFDAEAGGKTFSLAPELPHWSLSWQGRRHATGGRAGFVALGASLLALLVASLFGGGALLVRDARRQRLEATRKTDFVSSVSHELRTPLTSIRMYAELLAERRVSDPGKEAKFLGIIVSESERLSRLVDNVLDFGRLEQGRKTFSTGRVGLRAFVGATLDAARAGLAAAGLDIRFDAPEDMEVSADRDALSQVLFNVLDNAAKYASKQGADVLVSLRRAGANARPALARILVADRGPGIPPGLAPKIFDKFFRVDTRVTATTGGCGLGLSIARLLMRGMGGDITHAPRPGGGSIFEITIPMEETRHAAQPHASKRRPRRPT